MSITYKKFDPYKEVDRKGKGRLVFTDVNALVSEFEDQAEIRDDDRKDDYEIACPYCVEGVDIEGGEPYYKRKLYIDKEELVGHCFRCDSTFLNVTDDLSYQVKAPKTMSQSYYSEPVKLSSKRFGLDIYTGADPIDEESCNWILTKRLKNGRFHEDSYPELANILKGLKFKTDGKDVLIPFYFGRDLLYYQIYFKVQKGDLKYWNPPIEVKMPYIIPVGDMKKFILVEGVFDAIACLLLYPGYTPVALLGSTVTDYHMFILKHYVPSEILVFMDDTALSLKALQALVTVFDYSDLNHIPSKGVDPEEYLLSQRTQSLRRLSGPKTLKVGLGNWTNKPTE